MWLSFTFALLSTTWGFPGGSDGKEAACNFPYAQLVKNLPAMQDTWVWSLGWEDPLEKGKATHSSILV